MTSVLTLNLVEIDKFIFRISFQLIINKCIIYDDLGGRVGTKHLFPPFNPLLLYLQ